MKNRRNIVVAFLLCACLIVGVGFAELTDTLTIGGSATIDTNDAKVAFDEDIKFTSATITATNTTGKNYDDSKEDKVSCSDDTVTFEVYSLKGQNDYVTFTVTIENAGDVDAIVTLGDNTIGNTADGYFNMDSDWSNRTIAAEGSATFTVTIKLNKTPTDSISCTTFNMTFNVVSVDA